MLPIQAQLMLCRPMRLDDISRVHEIDVLSFPLPWPENSFLFELTENPSTLALVGEITPQAADPLVIGMVIDWIVVDEAHIATIAIHPDFRGNGYGRQLLAETLRQSIRHGAVVATLEVREHNTIAQQMYRAFGFSPVGRRVHYYKDNNEDAIIMTLSKMSPAYLTWLDKIGSQ